MFLQFPLLVQGRDARREVLWMLRGGAPSMKFFKWFDYPFFLVTLPLFVLPYGLSVLLLGVEPRWIDKVLDWYFDHTR